MKKYIFSLSLVFGAFYCANARKLIVTLGTDNVNNPTIGMLRYYIKNALVSDTITFNVDRVNLLAELGIDDINMVIDGSSRGTVTLDAGSNGRVFSISCSDKTLIGLKNLIIQNGKSDTGFTFGGGMYIFTTFLTTGDVVVENCVFQNNQVVANVDGQGGAVRCQGGTFKNCTFLNNKVTGTTTSLAGGAVVALRATFINCLFSGNSARYAGGIYCIGACKIFNCTITKNQSELSASAGGISMNDYNSSEIVNCIVYDNKANGSINNIDVGTDAGKYSNCATDTNNPLVGKNGNIGLSITPFKLGSGVDSLTLNPNTLCIDRGTTQGIQVLPFDIQGNARVINGAIDIGAYESTTTTKPIIITQSAELNKVCSGAKVVLKVLTNGAVPKSISWKRNNTPLSTSTDSIVILAATLADTGSYVCFVSNSLGNVTSIPMRIDVNPSPIITLTVIKDSICNNAPATSLSALPTGGTWTGKGVSNNSFSAIAAGVGKHRLTYSATNANNCSAKDSIDINVKNCTVGTGDFEENIQSINIFPNPVFGSVIYFKINALKSGQINGVIMDVDGRIVDSIVNKSILMGEQILTIASPKIKGMYIVKLYFGSGLYSAKVFVQ